MAMSPRESAETMGAQPPHLVLLCFLCCRATIHTIAQRIFGHISASISKPRPYLFSLVTHPDLRNKKDIFAALFPPPKKKEEINF